MTWKSWLNCSCHKQQLFNLVQIIQSFYIYLHFLYIHRYLYITNITPHSPDDGSVEPKRYNVDLVPQ